jgi:DNA-binding NtrC family response regulator
VAPRTGHVLIHGPSGTGKELSARALHELSGRKGALVTRNAATLPAGLVDAELFGNLKGYPNPGMPERSGLVGAAHGGTLFLDEFADLPEGGQTHLLRLLDGGEYHRLGESRRRHADLRLVAATNRSLSELRSDLLARFEFRIETPSLGQRREDVPLLARHLLRQMTKADPVLQRRCFAPNGCPRLASAEILSLARDPLELNARELKQRFWAALAVGGEGLLASTAALPSPAPQPASDHTAEQLQRALDAHNGSIENTWRALGLSSRHALARLIKKHGVQVTRRR